MGEVIAAGIVSLLNVCEIDHDHLSIDFLKSEWVFMVQNLGQIVYCCMTEGEYA